MKIAIVGCIHGELDTVYEQLGQLEKQKGYKIDLLLINGDFQSIRNNNDFKCVCIPPKYRQLGTFHQYYFGQRKAPILTIFIGGNHEASNYLITLPYGGWVAPNIYYMGYSNVIQFNGLRIGGISGIFNRPHTEFGHFERLPMTEDTKRSAYHTRHLEAYRLMRIKQDLDIFMSHDWPSNICHYGDINGLLRRKPFFAQDINSGKLGSPMLDDLLTQLKPRYWFSAHLHVRFEANVAHDPERTTKFLALDKCLPRRHYLEIIDIEPRKEPKELGFFYDKEWLAILRLTNEFLSIDKYPDRKMPDLWTEPKSKIEDELPYVEKNFEDLHIPDNFQLSPPVFSDDDIDPGRTRNFVNPQTIQFCDKLGVDDPMQLILELSTPKPNPEEILLSDEESESQTSKEAGSGDDLFFIDKRGDNLQRV